MTAASVRERKLEFFVVAVALGILLYLLLDALATVQREMEEATVQAEIAALRIELLDRLAHRAGFGGELPPGDNPVVWAGRAPAGYIGEVDTTDGNGLWYFARGQGILVYRFRAGDEWRFRLVRSGRGGDGALLGGVGLARVEAAVAERRTK